MAKLTIGIIGGSGLDNPDILKEPHEIAATTPYGKPSSTLMLGKIEGIDVVILARHDREHSITPTGINNRANLRALKDQGVTHIIATTACGSLREEIGRGDFVMPDQFIDFTRHRNVTFFEHFKDGAKHTGMADPFDKNLRKILISASRELGFRTHDKGTIITIEGPRFSTRAESHMFRAWGADIINMSTAPEAVLANELQIPYAAIAMSTDYDCWKADEAPVTFDEILKVFGKNVNNVKKLIILAVKKIGEAN